MVSVGIDAARAFGTGCFKDHRTHDTRGMTEQELRVSPPRPLPLHIN